MKKNVKCLVFFVRKIRYSKEIFWIREMMKLEMEMEFCCKVKKLESGILKSRFIIVAVEIVF